MPALPVNPSVTVAIPSDAPAHAISASRSRNCTAMPSDTMIDGTIRLATAV
jgi:hypothetical protein